MDDIPYPSILIYGISGTRPLHVVCAYSEENDLAIVITTYQQDPNLWIEVVKMKCVICNSSDIVEKEVDEELKIGNNIVLIPILTKVCRSCGERY